MDIVCSGCKKKIILPEDKIPQSKSFTLTCPECKTKINVNLIEQNTNQNSDSLSKKSVVPDNHVKENWEQESELDFIESGEKTALFCDTGESELIMPQLQKAGYFVRRSTSAEDAITRIRFTIYDIIVLFEQFGTTDNLTGNPVLNYIQPMPMATRRKMFVVLICGKIRTFDCMEAFVRSVNLIVNTKDLSNFSKILKNGLSDHEKFYKIYKESLKEIIGY